jgi:Citrate lyase, alpha subunit
MSHGGRPRAIESGELHIDVAFIAAPCCDAEGNMNGAYGKSACGVLSYAYADAEYADQVVAVTDNLVSFPASPVEISQEKVDYVVEVEAIGDPEGISFGPTKPTEDSVNLKIAETTAQFLDEAGYIRDGMSMQTGAGGTSIAVAAAVGNIMRARNVKGSFASGGITSYFVDMLKEGLFRGLLDVQCFDSAAIESYRDNPKHMAMSASQYANPNTKGALVNLLDIMILGATEMDIDFNLNVVTGSNGVILSSSGGNNDCAAGAKIAVVVTNLVKRDMCILRDNVTTVVTPGETVDVLVTEYGIAINPLRTDLLEKLKRSKLPIMTIHELKAIGESKAAKVMNPEFTDKVVAVVEYRDGTIIDVVRKPVQEF